MEPRPPGVLQSPPEPEPESLLEPSPELSLCVADRSGLCVGVLVSSSACESVFSPWSSGLVGVGSALGVESL